MNQAQLIVFLEWALERRTTSCSKRPGRGCFPEEDLWASAEDVPGLVSRIDALGGGFESIRLLEAEEGDLN